MKIEEAKDLFIAQYMGQRIWNTGLMHPQAINTYSLFKYRNLEESYLLLRSVDQLTDEECLNIGKLYGRKIGQTPYVTKQNHISSVREKLTAYENGLINIIAPVAQYCNRVGILLKFLYIDESGNTVTIKPDEIILLGWAKYKPNLVKELT